MLVTRAITVALAMAAGACTAKSPDVPNTGSGIDAGQVFADIVVAFGNQAEPEICGTALPTCGEEPPECGPPEVLGPPDDEVYQVAGFIDLGFRCTPIVERGLVAEIRVWGDEIVGSEFFVSDDGTEYQELDIVANVGPGYLDFDLEEIELPYVRFVRIIGAGGLDAIEALSEASIVPVDGGPGFDAALPDGAPAI